MKKQKRSKNGRFANKSVKPKSDKERLTRLEAAVFELKKRLDHFEYRKDEE